jgi:hypothetical protein
VIAPGVGALWIALLMAVAGEPTTTLPPAPASAEAAPAASSVVAVRRPPPGDTVLEETGSRIRSELSAMGLEGQFVDCPPDAAGGLGTCADIAAPATISLTRDDGVVEIAVRTILPDGLELSRHVRVLAPDGGDDPSVLAVRAVELLRDLRLTVRRPPPRRPGGPARDDEEPKLPPPPPLPPRWHLSAGVALLASPRGDQPGVGPAFAPTIAAGTFIGPSLSIVGSLAGPFDVSLGPIDTRSAALLQALATLELRFRLPIGPLKPFASVLTGVNYLKASIPGTSNIRVSNTSAWVPLFGVGAGLSWSFRTRYFVCAEAAAFVTAPNELLYIEDDNMVGKLVGRTGAPSVLVSSSAGLTLP